MAEAKTKAVSSVKSGVTNHELLSKTLGGLPPKKSVESIEKVNTPGKAPGSAKD